ncbi:hypothetical protein KM176_19130 [Pseudooceanicola sp. CBS1P-1]|uniref:DnaA N-terminal domain-containing protein n=1 Tax=Pseudooceanicola albus TaxID=2692189 RepID=A0A6L7G842_9RHOB|nr:MULTISPECIES: DnaA N-terminal domain-containing protein [Pseudooceanicola]MBT9385993.1 hypothetical protein [Pseudooceanicola endophyticus]MXN19586.1 hypothetical protein [Pseudooceanicola albus]
MQVAKPAGPGAAARKYDILSALMAYALAADRLVQRRVLRIMALITARYNWSRDELCVGQREIARLWSVEERTVKREMATLRSMGWLVQKRRGARGHLSVYGLDLDRILEDTRGCWPNVGPDFVERMDPAQIAPEETNVVPLRAGPAPVATGSVWGAVQARLHAEDPVTYGAWFHALTEVELAAGRLVLAAPSAFHASYVRTHLATRLLAAARRADPSIAELRIEE